jgi:murein DD-endopeptidase MepM/ murein hydrolase activator NlpD
LIIRKKKYHYNPDTLTFHEIRHDKKTRARHYLVYAVILVIFSGLSGYFLTRVLGSPENYFLEKKASVLSEQLNRLSEQSEEMEETLHASSFVNDNLYRTILELDTLPLSVRTGGTGGSAIGSADLYHSSASRKLEGQVERLEVQLNIQRNSFASVYEAALEHIEKLKHLPAIQPVPFREVLYISSYFGVRTDPFNHEDEENHTGIDFVAPYGTDVFAAADGTVTLCRISRTVGYGNEIVINHSFGYSTRYAHLQEILINEGDMVKRGQLIGRVGSSGRSTGPHLHYEVRYENRAVNPITYFTSNLTQNEYDEITELAKNQGD